MASMACLSIRTSESTRKGRCSDKPWNQCDVKNEARHIQDEEAAGSLGEEAVGNLPEEVEAVGILPGEEVADILPGEEEDVGILEEAVGIRLEEEEAAGIPLEEDVDNPGEVADSLEGVAGSPEEEELLHILEVAALLRSLAADIRHRKAAVQGSLAGEVEHHCREADLEKIKRAKVADWECDSLPGGGYPCAGYWP